MIRVLAWWLRILVHNVPSDVLASEELAYSRTLLLRYAQKDIVEHFQDASTSGKGSYRKLASSQDDDGVWRVGSRMRNYVPFTFDSKMPVIIPYHHRITKLVMREAHIFSHPGQDGTLSRFRAKGYWTTRAGKLAKKVKYECVPCRKEDHATLQQPMGELPEERLYQLVAWGCC